MKSVTSIESIWDEPVQFLKGVGPRRADSLAKLGITTVADLLLNLPRRYLDRSHIVPIAGLTEGQTVTVLGKVAAAGVLKGQKSRFEVILDDGSDRLALLWFAGWRFLQERLKRDVQLAVSGTVTRFRDALQIVHPQCEYLEDQDIDDLTHTGRLIPIYPSGETWRAARLDSRALRRIIKPLLDTRRDRIPDYLDHRALQALGLPPLGEAVVQVHFPESVRAAAIARRRHAFDELFFFELSMAKRRTEMDRKHDGRACRSSGQLPQQIITNLPWPLTGAQKRVIEDIVEDLRSPRAMRRLLQGDVGAGKTIVAAIAMAHWVEAGAQTALLVPTEILAEQHHRTLSKLFNPLGVIPVLVTGSLATAERRAAKEQIESGAAHVIVGTHALLTKKTRIADLGFVIIDEQHRFGVAQRQSLVAKGHRPDLLVMTATPIPRTLTMTYYGDLDVSILDELPPKKGTIRTVVRSEEAREKIYKYIEEATASGDLVYIVYPLVEESEKLDLKAAVAGYDQLKSRFPKRTVGLVHGRTPRDERAATMDEFYSGRLNILVSTTVIEVGVDAPAARLMIIENAERFGLSQLHQLRGRIGRGPGQSICVLMRGAQPTPIASERLETMCATNDGFKIAETDLRLRGPGEYLGTRQHGLPNFAIADLNADADLVGPARHAAFDFVANGGDVSSESRSLVHLEWKRRKGTHVEYLRAG